MLQQERLDNERLYAADEAPSHDPNVAQDEQVNQNFDFADDEALNDVNEEIDVRALNDEERQNVEKRILYYVQGVGSIQSVGGFDVYVKSQYCEESIRDLIKMLKSDANSHPIAKHVLLQWGFPQKDLLPLLVFQNKDKKLSFLTLMVLVMLTTVPSKDCEPVMHKEILDYMSKVKASFLEPKVIDTLMTHLADCIQCPEEEKTPKHNQMIELIIVQLKNLLTIPSDTLLHKQLLLKLSETKALDAFCYLTQEFTEIYQKKLAMHFLEIFQSLFSCFEPIQIIDPQSSEQTAIREMKQKDLARKRHRDFVAGMRHSKFGAQIGIKREDGSVKLIGNIYQQNIDVSSLGATKQIKGTSGGGRKGTNNQIEAKASMVDDAAKTDTDRELLRVLYDFLVDIMQNSYGVLVEELKGQMLPQQIKLEENDRLNLFKLQSFVLEVCRRQAHVDHNRLQKESNANTKPGQKKKLVPFKIDISMIGSSLQYQAIDFCFSQLFMKILGKRSERHNAANAMMHDSQMPVSDSEFHAALQLLNQYLLIVQDMANCTGDSEDDERNRKNAQILKAYIFKHELLKVLLFALESFQPARHQLGYLEDTIRVTNLYLQMLEDFSRGRIIRIKTGKTARRKKQKKTQDNDNFSDDELANGDDGQDNNNNLACEEDESSDCEEHEVERTLNFVGEFAMIAKQKVIKRMIWAVENQKLGQKSEVLGMVADYFRRILVQLKTPWLFFQADFMASFEGYLRLNSSAGGNNQLMMGLNSGESATDRQLRASQERLQNVIRQIVSQFVSLMKVNPMLMVESLFRFSDASQVNQMLNNYFMEGGSLDVQEAGNNGKVEEVLQDVEYNFDVQAEDQEEQNNINVEEREPVEQQWTEEQDMILIENYPKFKQLSNKQCFSYIAELIDNKDARQVFARYKALKLKHLSSHEAKERSDKLRVNLKNHAKDTRIGVGLIRMLLSYPSSDQQQPQNNSESKMPTVFQIMNLKDFLSDVFEQLQDFEKAREDAIVFGSHLDVQDLNLNASETSEKSGLRIVPVTKEEFAILADPRMVGYMQMFGIERVAKQQFLRVMSDSGSFKQGLDYLTEVVLPKLTNQCVNSDNETFDRSLLKECQMS